MNWFRNCCKRKKMQNGTVPNSDIKKQSSPIPTSSKGGNGFSCSIDAGKTMESPIRSVTIESNGARTPSSDPELIASTEVTIREATPDELTSISGVLRYCKRVILYPYLRLLGVMALKPLGIPEENDSWTILFVLNKVYITTVTILLLIGYVLQFLTCYRRDRGFAITKEPPHLYGFADSASNSTTCDGNPLCGHILPSLLHFSSFIYMVYLYRVNEDEQLPNLMERVLIQASHAHSSFVSQKRLLRTLQFMLFFSLTWIILSGGSQVLQIATHSFNFTPAISISDRMKNGLIILMGLSGLWQDAVQVTVIVSYCIHCRLLSTYFNLIHARIQQHSISLPECIKEIGELDKLLRYLNNDLATGLGPLLLMDAAFAVSSISFIVDKGRHLQILDLISLAIIAFLWVLIVVLPTFEAAKLSTSTRRVGELGHLARMRPFGYQEIPQTDLDSFLLFVSTLKMNVHICRISISAPILAFIGTTTMFIILIWGLIWI